MKRFIHICGVRPHLTKYSSDLPGKMIWTGQHFDKNLKDVFLKGLKIKKPDYEINETELGKMIDGITEVLKKENPHYVLVYGDTRSTVAGAIAAHQLNIPIIHVEAGARSGNNNMIEERNRKLVDHISLIHLTASIRASYNLQLEGIANNAFIVGCANFSNLMKVLPTEKLVEGKYSVLTIHRAENTDDAQKIKNVFEGLKEYDGTIIFPAHPRTKKFIEDSKIVVPSNIKIEEPASYKRFVSLMGLAEYVITDSGGAQAEAYFLRTPCITLRTETEWTETIDEGWNILVGTDPDQIKMALAGFKPKKQQHNSAAYGIGKSHNLIKTILTSL